MAGRDVYLVSHEDDEGVDEVVLMGPGRPLLRARMVPRYKTSGLSGDEWRVGAMWQQRINDAWEDLDGPYHDLDTACRAIYCGVYTSHPTWHNLECVSTRLLRKGHPVIEMTNAGKSLPLLAALGHLPWTMVIWHEQDHAFSDRGIFGGNATPDLCFQVGCAEPAISTYALKTRYARNGTASEAADGRGRRHARRFCIRHLRRGDCGLDDADNNYDVIGGPGPDGHRMRPTDESESRVVVLDGADPEGAEG